MGRTAAGDLGRYHHDSPTAVGSGVFSDLARRALSSGYQHIIKSVKNANLPQKITDLAVRGAKRAGEHLGAKAGNKLKKIAHDKGLAKYLPKPGSGIVSRKRTGSSLQSVRSRKRRRRPPTAQELARIDQLINHSGNGILLE